MSELIDTPEELLAEDLGITPEKAIRVLRLIESKARENQAIILGRVLGFLVQSNNQPAMIYAFCIAAGLDQLNDIETETQVADRLGVSRALISHYVCGARDILSGKQVGDFDNTKFRKHNESRKVYSEGKKSGVISAKRAFLSNY